MASKRELLSRSIKRSGGAGKARWLRPQSVLFSLLAEHLLDRDLALFSGSIIEVLGSLGVGEHATRSTLARMTRRGLLEAQRKARKSYLRMTPRCVATLEDGRERIWTLGAVNRELATPWTLLTFSLPEAWRKKRYELRAQLTWAGFGLLQSGAWLAPFEVDVAGLIERLDVAAHARVFHVKPAAPTDAKAVMRDTFPLLELAERYRAFLRSWERPNRRLRAAPLQLTLSLSTHWLSIVRDDPRVPIGLLPHDWPAIAAQRLFRSLHAEHFPAAKQEAGARFDTL
jgi:phenylacetic acid degradation operon negative regulatory protein